VIACTFFHVVTHHAQAEKGVNWDVISWTAVRSRYKRRLIQLNLNKSGLHGLEWKTRDPYSLVHDSLITRTHCNYAASELKHCAIQRTGDVGGDPLLRPKTISPPALARCPKRHEVGRLPEWCPSHFCCVDGYGCDGSMCFCSCRGFTAAVVPRLPGCRPSSYSPPLPPIGRNHTSSSSTCLT